MPSLPPVLMPPGRPRVLVAMAVLAAIFGGANCLALLTAVPGLISEQAGVVDFIFMGLIVLPLFAVAPLAFAFEVRAGRPRALSIGISWWIAILILDALVMYWAWYQASSAADQFSPAWLLGPGLVAAIAIAAIAYFRRSRRALRDAAKTPRSRP